MAMEERFGLLDGLNNYPCHLQTQMKRTPNGCTFLNRKNDKWKKQSLSNVVVVVVEEEEEIPYWNYCCYRGIQLNFFVSTTKTTRYVLLLLLLLLLQMFAFQPILSSQSWDGVVITEADYQALQALKHDLIDPQGVLRSWNDTGYGACSGKWVGIKCAQGQVIVIQLPWRGLGGHISEKIGQFSALRKLSLHDNSIGGMVPWSLGFLPDLRGVQLFNNRFSGSIPPSIGACPLLQSLDLSNNLLTGFIPPSLSNSTRLSRLNLSFNALSGSIPSSLTRSPSLAFLALQYNNLSGSLPVSLSKLSKLVEISLSHNQINGVIPNQIGTLSKLQTLDLSYNAINGSFPPSLCNLSTLLRLDLEGNRIQSQIPDEVDGLQKLVVLNLKRNQFSGEIPASLGKVSSLTQFDVSQNGLTGNIPSSLVDLTRLTFLNVSYNQLSGSVPFPLTRKFNSSSFIGNLELCGYSVSTPCPTSPSPPPSSNPRRSKLSTKHIILVAAGALLAVLFILASILLCFLITRRRRRRRRATAAAKPKNGQAAAAAAAAASTSEKEAAEAAGRGVDLEAAAAAAAGGEVGGKLVHFDGPFLFTADDLLCATAEIMGKSTYGTVYKATLESGNEVAVKRLREKIAKGQKEFQVEVNKLGKIRHPNLLSLRAYYLGPKGEKLLVFDFMPRGSLTAFLHARGPDTPIDWPTRLNIIIGTVRGLDYLHTHEHMVHGNLTSGNILLDENTNAKIADYGLSKLMTAAANSNVIATAAALGYRAPELSKLKKANTKTDVYSLGVVILELLTGKSPGEAAMNGGGDLPHWVASIVKEEWTNEVFDLELMRDASTIGDELLITLKLALHCVDPSPTTRPELHQLLHQLEEIIPDLAAASSSDGTAAPSTNA